jgi:hypothetical protein
VVRIPPRRHRASGGLLATRLYRRQAAILWEPR